MELPGASGRFVMTYTTPELLLCADVVVLAENETAAAKATNTAVRRINLL
jgi:hypothetical protein